MNGLALQISRTAELLSGSPYVSLHFHPSGRPSQRWTAVAQCKPRGRKYRLIRGYGRTHDDALHDLAKELDAFQEGTRDGEQ